ncbi:xanthine dehydrogenase family protein molybdopterin-binding subunit, partial [Streptomyces sp. NPDC001215]
MPNGAPTKITQYTKGGIGESTLRPDGTLKVTGEFAYSSDMWHEDMLWGQLLRSTVAHAEIVSIDTSEALATPGVYAVMTYDDLPTEVRNYGLEIQDTPVLAHGKVRHHGEPVAIVAADHPETARRAAARIRVEYRELPLVTDEASATAPDAVLVHENRTDHHSGHVPHPNVVHRQPVVRGDVERARRRADVIVEGEYHFGMQDQAFLGPESGLAVPAEDGGVDLYVATQWLHADLRQIAPVLGLPEDKVRMTLAGVGGAFGGREDLSMQIHACLLALRTGKPVKIVYNRFESFFGHVHRHPAKLYYEHGATKDGKLTHVRCRIVLDGGAYASSSPAVVGNAASLGVGPYVVDDVDIEALALYTNNPPCGAMRGFGAVQACFAYEAQMDKVARKLGMDPVEFRRRNAMSQGAVMPTGQIVDSPAPVAELLRRVKAMPMPPERQWESSEGADHHGGGERGEEPAQQGRRHRQSQEQQHVVGESDLRSEAGEQPGQEGGAEHTGDPAPDAPRPSEPCPACRRQSAALAHLVVRDEVDVQIGTGLAGDRGTDTGPENVLPAPAARDPEDDLGGVHTAGEVEQGRRDVITDDVMEGPAQILDQRALYGKFLRRGAGQAVAAGDVDGEHLAARALLGEPRGTPYQGPTLGTAAASALKFHRLVLGIEASL